MLQNCLQINNCYDSHVHWLATGDYSEKLLLHDLNCAADIRNKKILNQHYRDKWLIGFGWDQNKWASKEFPTKHILDELFPDKPVAFFRADGHALWVNSHALSLAGIVSSNVDPVGGKILRSPAKEPTGVLIDLAMDPVKSLIPQPHGEQIKKLLLAGMNAFNQAGITHIRDMTCSEEQWQEEVKLDQEGLLTLAIEQYFSVDDPKNYQQAIELACRAKNENHVNLRPMGVKIYFDGALGSEGALLSQNYQGQCHCGLALMETSLLNEVLLHSWQKSLDVAVHAIGDEAAHQVVTAAKALWDSGKKGWLHLEHSQMLRPETINLMKGQTVACHMQPCHWLSDQRFLKDKLGPLEKYVFPWRALEENKILFDFGSDSPIEAPRIKDSVVAVSQSQEQGIPATINPAISYHQYLDTRWTPNTYSVFDQDYLVKEVYFRGKKLI